VLGLREGATSVPAHLAREIVETAELIQLKDAFGYERLKAGVYTAGQTDAAWTDPIREDSHDWVRQRIDTLPVEQRRFLRGQP
jgi:hypothetical protein